MTDKGDFEREALCVARGAVAEASADLLSRGIRLGGAELTRDGRTGDSEIRVYAYAGEQICDALEAHVWRAGEPAATLEELREWFRVQLLTLR